MPLEPLTTTADGSACELHEIKPEEHAVTPKMLLAGRLELAGFDGNQDNHEECVTAIYLTMCAAAPKLPSNADHRE